MPERELERVPESLGRQQGCAGATTLDNGIGGKRRAVDHQLDLLERNARSLQDRERPADHPFLGRSRGEHLAGEKTCGCLKHDIREGPPDIDSESAPGTCHVGPRWVSRQFPDLEGFSYTVYLARETAKSRSRVLACRLEH